MFGMGCRAELAYESVVLGDGVGVNFNRSIERVHGSIRLETLYICSVLRIDNDFYSA